MNINYSNGFASPATAPSETKSDGKYVSVLIKIKHIPLSCRSKGALLSWLIVRCLEDVFEQKRKKKFLLLARKWEKFRKFCELLGWQWNAYRVRRLKMCIERLWNSFRSFSCFENLNRQKIYNVGWNVRLQTPPSPFRPLQDRLSEV